MLRLISYFFLGLCLWSFAIFTNAADQVKHLNIKSSANDTEIEFDLSANIKHSSFQLSNPWRLVVDFENAEFVGRLPNIDTTNPHIKVVRTGLPGENKIRFVFELKQRITSEIQQKFSEQGNQQKLLVSLTSSDDQSDSAQVPELFSNQSQIEQNKPNNIASHELVVAIDAGHGGADPGAIGYRGSHEKVLTLQIARKLKAVIDQAPSMRAVLIRDTDKFVELHKRRLSARNKKADIFLSIHADAFTKQSARGFSVFALSQRGATSAMARALAEKENAVDLIGGVSLADKDQVLAEVLVDLSMTNTISESVNLGGRVLKELSKLGKLHSKRVEQAGFAVLKSPDMPSILIETGFLTNPQDEKNLLSSSYQDKVVNAIYTAIDEYYQQTPYYTKSTYASPSLNSQSRASRQSNSRPAVHTVKSGESLSLISAKYNVTITALKRLNNLSKNTVYIGQKIKLPGGTKVSPAKASVHTVKRGDTLSEIADKYAIKLSTLKRINNLSKNTVYVGQKLKLTSASSTSTKPDFYTVKSGDSLSEIAQKYSLKLSTLKSINNLTKNTVYIGQKLKLSPSSNASTKPQYHKVKNGDTLSEIAEKYQLSIKRLKSLNNLRSESIRIGQRLKVSS